MSRTRPNLTIDTGTKPRSLSTFLDNLGPLSELPSPTSRKSSECYFTGLSDEPEESIYDDKKQLRGIAKAFARLSSAVARGDKIPAATVKAYLEAARLPVESLALAYNVLNEYGQPASTHQRHDSFGPDELKASDIWATNATQPALLILASFQIAASYLNHKRSEWSYWASEVGMDTVNTTDLWNTSSELYHRIESDLDTLASSTAIDAACLAIGITGDVSPSSAAFSPEPSPASTSDKNILSSSPLELKRFKSNEMRVHFNIDL